MGNPRLFRRIFRVTSPRRILFSGAALLSLFGLFLPPPVALARPRMAPAPSVSLGVPAQVPLGEAFSFTVSFDNTSAVGSDVGYGPIVDLLLPINGADGNAGTTPDGIALSGYVPRRQWPTVLPFPDADPRQGRPAASRILTIAIRQRLSSGMRTAGDALVVPNCLILRPTSLPHGQHQATLSNLADLSTRADGQGAGRLPLRLRSSTTGAAMRLPPPASIDGSVAGGS
jgi:hypothetical protein